MQDCLIGEFRSGPIEPTDRST